MPRLQIEATKLEHTDVSFVSLVKHGANRIPFRIMKGETEVMLDLAKIGLSLFKKADVVPAVVAVLVSKSADMTKLQPAMEKAGLVFTEKAEGEGGLVFMQPGATPGPRDGIMRVNDDVAFSVSGLADLPKKLLKEFAPWNADSTDFNAVLNTQGFFPGMCLAMEALQGTVYNIMKDAEDPAMAATMVEAAIDSFKGYVMPCVTGIPVRAFKAENGISDAFELNSDPAKRTPPWGNQLVTSNSHIGLGPNGETAFAGGPGTNLSKEEIELLKKADVVAKKAGMIMVDGKWMPDPKAKPIKKAEISIGVGVAPESSPMFANQGRGDMTVGAGAEPPIGTDLHPEPNKVLGPQDANTQGGHGGKTPWAGEAPIGVGVKPETSPMFEAQGRGDVFVAGMMKGLEDLFSAKFGELQTQMLASLTKVDTSVAGVSKRIEMVEARTKKAEEAISGTALGDAPGDGDGAQRTQKSEGAPPLLDTAYNRRAA